MLDLSELRTWLVQEGITANDTLLTAIEARAVALVQQWTGRYFGATDTGYTEYLDGNGEQVIYITDTPTAEPAMYTRDSLLSSWIQTAITYVEHEDRKVINLLEPWPEGVRNVKAVYSRGYASGSVVPSDIRQLVFDTCKALFLDSRMGEQRTGEPNLLDRIPFAAQTVAKWRSPLL